MPEAVHPKHPDCPDKCCRRGYADMAIRSYGRCAETKIGVQKKSQEDYIMVDIETIRIAEKISGEKLLDDDDQNIASDKKDEPSS